MKKNLVTIAIGILVILLITAVVVLITSEDKTGPEITFNIPAGQQITYKSGDDKQQLIKYAKAVDGKDGDVSDSLMIEDIYVASDLTTARVVYVARDKSKNITRVTKEVKYIASQEEIDDLTKASEKETGTDQSATTSATVASTKAEESTKASAKPVLTLSKSEATINRGANFSAASYVKEITDDKDDRDTLSRRVIVAGDYDTNVAGDYTISIYCTDTDGNVSNMEKFVLHVQSAVTQNQAPATEEENAANTSDNPVDTDNTDNTGTNTDNTGTNTDNIGTNTDNTGTNTDNTGTKTDNTGSNTDNSGTKTDNTGSNTTDTPAGQEATTAPVTTVTP